MNPDGKPFLTFAEFLDGMVNIKVNKDLGLADKFNLTKPNQLMSLVMDTPVAAWEHKQIMEGFDGLEKMGMAVLNRNDSEMSQDRKRRLMERANEGKIHELEPEQASNLKSLHHKNVMQAFVIGFLSCVRSTCMPVCSCCSDSATNKRLSFLQTCTSIVENIMTSVYETDGIGDACDSCFVTCFDEGDDAGLCKALPIEAEGGNGLLLERWYSNTTTCTGYPDDPAGFHCKTGFPMLNVTSIDADDAHLERVTMFWSFNGAALGICTALEIAGLYYFGILNAVKVANMIDMRLLPMNRDRATVAQSLIRAALELGQSNVVSEVPVSAFAPVPGLQTWICLQVALGIDPLREEAKQNKILNGVFAVLYMAKIFLTGFAMKGTCRPRADLVKPCIVPAQSLLVASSAYG